MMLCVRPSLPVVMFPERGNRHVGDTGLGTPISRCHDEGSSFSLLRAKPRVMNQTGLR